MISSNVLHMVVLNNCKNLSDILKHKFQWNLDPKEDFVVAIAWKHSKYVSLFGQIRLFISAYC